MQKNKIFTMLFLFLVCLVIPNQFFSQPATNLKGFDTLRVKVENLPPELDKLGLTKEQIQTDVETKLRQAGFTIKDIFEPALYISVEAIEDNCGGFAVNVRTDLIHSVILKKDEFFRPSDFRPLYFLATWKSANIIVVNKSNLQQIRDVVSNQVDKFINDYQEANNFAKKQNTSIPPTNTPSVSSTKKDDSPFTATYVGGNSAPTIEVFNDSDRTMYFDFGQGNMTPYVIASGGRKKIIITEGSYNYKASAPRVKSDEGQENFKNGYIYTWRFYIVKVLR
jgi:hypothetical protein